jgi:hypothetical protein
VNAPTNLAARIAEIAENAKRKANRKPLPSAPLPKTVVQLPLWPEPVRAVPNGFLRSALFGAVTKGKRRTIDGEDIAALDGVSIRYKGDRLDQGDLDVWESVLHAARLQELGTQCRATSYSILKLMGLTDTGKNRKTLHSRIERLVACALTVKQGRYSYIGSLIAGAAKDEETQEWVIELNPKLAPLFAADQFTQIEWDVRHELAGKPLAQWLHGFYASHAKPYPIKIETLHKLCGSEAGEMWKFTQTLRKALDAVTTASNAHGEDFAYEVRNGLVHVEKKAKGTQRRHLAKKAGKRLG